MHFNLEDCVDKFSDMLESMSGEELERVLHSVTVEGTNWLPNKGQGIFMCARPNSNHWPKCGIILFELD